MQKSSLVSTRKDGVKVMVKIRDPKIFEILDSITTILKSQMSEKHRLIQSIRSEPREANPFHKTN